MPRFKTVYDQRVPIYEVRTTIFGSEFICLFCGETYDEAKVRNARNLITKHVMERHRRK